MHGKADRLLFLAAQKRIFRNTLYSAKNIWNMAAISVDANLETIKRKRKESKIIVSKSDDGGLDKRKTLFP